MPQICLYIRDVLRELSLLLASERGQAGGRLHADDWRNRRRRSPSSRRWWAVASNCRIAAAFVQPEVMPRP
jgi:hypothetical protein